MVEAKKASLTVLGGPLAGTRVQLPDSGRVSIGSAEGSTLRLELPSVSEYHAWLLVESGRVTVHATGIERPLHVNDSPVEPSGTVLRNGDILWLGAPGEEDVVMLQCILPRRAPEAAAPEPPAPTPEIETVALWTGTSPAAEPPPPTVPPPAGGYEPTVAIETDLFIEPEAEAPLSEAPPVAAAPAPEEELVVTAEVAPPAEDEAVVLDAGELAEPAATLLVTGPGELPTPEGAPTVAFQPEPTVVAFEAEPAEHIEFEAPAGEVGPRAAPAIPGPVSAAAEPAAAPLPPPAAAPSPRAAPPAPAPARAPAAPRPPAAARARAPQPPRQAPPPRRVTTPPSRPRVAAPAESTATPAVAAAEATPFAGPSRSALLAGAGLAGVLVVAAVGWAVWRFVLARPAPAPTPTPAAVARVSPPPPAVSAPIEPTPTPPPPTLPSAVATPAPVPTPPPRPGVTPTPLATPTPRTTPTPAAGRATPTPATPAQPSAEALRAQQIATQVEGLLGQADAALNARQYDAAVGHLDEVLRLDAANARGRELRATAVSRRDLARRRFVAGQTQVQTQKAQKEGGGELAGFDTGDADLRKAPDFQGRIEFEMTPASGLEAGQAWTLKVYVVNDGKKPIRVQGVTVATSINGAGGGGPIPSRARDIPPQQRALLGEASGSWRDGTTSWSTEVTVTANKGDSLRNTIVWK